MCDYRDKYAELQTRLRVQLQEAEDKLAKHKPRCPMFGGKVNNTESVPGVQVQRTVTLHPQYPGAVLTKYLRGTDYSDSNDMVISMGQDVVSHVAHNYYEGIASEPSLQNFYVSLRYTLPDDFVNWASENAIQIGFRTESGTYLNSHVSVFAYKSAKYDLVTSNSNNAMTEWGVIVLPDVYSEKVSWSPGDVLELYIGLASRNDYYARVGGVKFSYIGSGSSPAVTVVESGSSPTVDDRS